MEKKTPRSNTYATHEYEIWGVKDGVAVILSIESIKEEDEGTYANDNPSC
tara:strand:+ start:9959 stop:10108 length:150 start_codon:yes stop_codon:yes gene_type:complete